MKKLRLKRGNVIFIIFASLVILVVFLYVLVSDYNNDTKAIYGSRLDGIEEVKLSKSKLNDIKENVESSNMTESVSVSIQGKIINLEIVINSEVSRDDAKTLGGKVIEKLSDEEKKFYDVQLFIDKKEDATFPIIGYRHHAKEDFSWTLDR